MSIFLAFLQIMSYVLPFGNILNYLKIKSIGGAKYDHTQIYTYYL